MVSISRGTPAGVGDDDAALPDQWSETKNVTWKTDGTWAAGCSGYLSAQDFGA
jgi:hypothetical protein